MTKAKTKNNKLSKEKLCSIFCKSRQGYYYKQKSSKYLSDKYKKIMDCITKYKRIMPYIGGRKLHYKLNNCDGIKIGRDTIFNILRDNALLVRRKKR